jgi:hypothetical protein
MRCLLQVQCRHRRQILGELEREAESVATTQPGPLVEPTPGLVRQRAAGRCAQVELWAAGGTLRPPDLDTTHG